MYKIKFTLPTTGSTIHSIDIDDDSLVDTWNSINIDDVDYDLNVWYDTNDDKKYELYISLYTLYNDENGNVQTDHSDDIRGVIIEVTSDESGNYSNDETFSNTDTTYFYYVEPEPECCEDCGDEFKASELIPWRYETEVKLCASCTDEREQEEAEEDN